MSSPATMWQKHWQTYISHYWHMPLNKYTCHTTHVCATICLFMAAYIPNITVHISKKTTKCNFSLPCYCHHLKPYICHMPKLFNVHQWEKFVNIYAAYAFTGINHVMGSAAHRKEMMQTLTMTNLQPNWISGVGCWPNKPKTLDCMGL